MTGSSWFPPGLKPAFALRDGFLVLASSPEAIRQFSSKDPKALPLKTAELPMLRLSLKEIRRFLKERREPLLAFLAQKNQISKEEMIQQLDGLIAGTQIFEQVEITQMPGEGQVVFTLRVKTAKPLK